MPYKSKEQFALFEMCRNNPEKATKVCPPKKVLDEFHRASFPETSGARSQQKKRGDVKFH